MEYLPRKISISKEAVKGEEIFIREYHLDTNHHVNNGQYVKMATQIVMPDHPIRMLRVEYKKQALLHDVMIPYLMEEENQSVVCFKDPTGSEVYAVVEFVS